MKKWMDEYSKASARLENIEKFFRWNPEANKMRLDYLREERQLEARKAAEQRAREREQRSRDSVKKASVRLKNRPKNRKDKRLGNWSAGVRKKGAWSVRRIEPGVAWAWAGNRAPSI
jgi:hypothetical protein